MQIEGENMAKNKVIVVGGGASGIFSAIVAAKNGSQVTILERNPRIGKKILATGNGRCNYTNTLTSQNDYNHPDFAAKALQSFGPKVTIDFFDQLGITAKFEEEGKTYPLSEQASSFLDVFMYQLDALNIDVVCNAHVQNILKNKSTFSVVLQDKTEYKADKVILCTGGKAMPSSGSDGLGYPIARKLGHHVTTIFPALVKLKLDYPYLKQMDGVKISSIVQLIHQKKVIQEEKGDILFTSYGISGPTILQLSRKVNELLLQHEKVHLNVILINSLTREEITQRFKNSMDKPVDFSLVGLINKKLISALLKEAKIEKQNTILSQLKDEEIKRIIDLLFNWEFKVLGSKGFEDAQVTAGGIDVNEINSMTMESKLVSGLYLAGEVIDIDGPCGGYNLQWAWSSGYVAGVNASR